ncbi:hypothetical protein K469DRAFT_206869 [Zopfia rhizophila CBS 207.26]|uniref:Uncharacterized protein n=1 Tax=Zopfia rhizophila CBS 207.26 TaxID=1314779 RepID=A0A6A6E1E8_9PEZI|nr:hypothetical protein K469DRAFT_206869 [Zopfia rhizophila CBS 207.26]
MSPSGHQSFPQLSRRRGLLPYSTRLGTPHSHKELKAAFETTPDVDQTFCLSVNNAILVFSASRDEHTMHCWKVLQILRDRSMRADINDYVFNPARSTDAGTFSNNEQSNPQLSFHSPLSLRMPSASSSCDPSSI